LGSREVGKLGSWEVGRLGSWEDERLGSWEVEKPEGSKVKWKQKFYFSRQAS